MSTIKQRPSEADSQHQYENKTFIYLNSKNGQKFSDEKIYLSILSNEDVTVKIKLWFGLSVEPNEQPNDDSNTKMNIMKKLLKHKKELGKNNLQNISSDLLHQRIKEIIKKRKEKLFDLSKGINLVEKNKNISKISEQDFLKSIEFKKIKKNDQIEIVLERKTNIMQYQLNQRYLLLNKHDNIKQIKREIIDWNRNYTKAIFIQHSWKYFVEIILVFNKIKNLLKAKKREQYKKIYYKQIRRIGILKVINRLNKIAENPTKRNLVEVAFLINYHANFTHSYLQENSDRIFINVIKQFSTFAEVHKKLENYIKNVIKIQNRWRTLNLRKNMFRTTIKTIWNKFHQQIFQILKKEKKQNTKISLIELEKLENTEGPSQANKRKREESIYFGIDNELQNTLIEKFMNENLVRYRKDMMEYREMILKLYSNKITKQKAEIIQKLIYGSIKPKLMRSNTFQRFSFESIEEDDVNGPIGNKFMLGPPQLFRKPKLDEIKCLIQAYYSQKKLL